MNNLSSTLIVVLALAPLVTHAAIASDKADVTATVKQYDDAFNRNDMKAWDALCTDQAVIIDDFAPHVWQGANACGNWWNDFDASAKKEGITDAVVTLGEAWHIAITGDRAYTVYPTRFTYKIKGKSVAERGVWTLTLQKLASGWRVAGWAWAQH